MTELDPKAVKPGIYRHYKGPLYELIAVARHSETGEHMAVYRTLYGDYDLWVRPLAMFVESVEHAGERQPRFRFLRASDDSPHKSEM